jgi:hypothetical protein
MKREAVPDGGADRGSSRCISPPTHHARPSTSAHVRTSICGTRHSRFASPSAACAPCTVVERNQERLRRAWVVRPLERGVCGRRILPGGMSR